MKIYDMVEGKWLEDEKPKEKKEIKEIKDLDIKTRLITYDEEKDWIERERKYIESTNRKKTLQVE